MEAGAAVDEEDIDSRRPLHRAAANGHTAVVAALLDKRASINLTDYRGNTALHFASALVGAVTWGLRCDAH